MNLLSELRPSANEPQVSYLEPIVLAGSCFSTHIAAKLRTAGFTVSSNPSGTVFHPVPIARFLLELLTDSPTDRSFQREDVFLSWDASSEVYAMSPEGLNDALEAVRSHYREQLTQAKVLLITLGSAHGYRLIELGEIVANCHKMPATLFEKELSTVEEMGESWLAVLKALQAAHPSLKVVFTVSPVRYSRDGWAENNRSKSRLFELITYLQGQFDVHYFPAYELVNDLLRDYRYFEPDGVHPNGLAIEQVWELFQLWHMDVETQRLAGEMKQLRQLQEHRLLFPESQAAVQFLQRYNEKRESFLSLHPYICW